MKLQVLFVISLLIKLISSENDVPIVVYWGQASKGTVQNDLSYYCESDSIDIIILAFVSVFGEDYINESDYRDGFELNLSNQCHYNGDYYDCPNVDSDIKRCQRLGKKVLLSLGGEQEHMKKPTYGFKSDGEGKYFARTIWHYFGESDEVEHRPFGDAAVDGFDIDAENQDQTGYLAFVQELSKIAEEKGSKSYYFSAAPQCSFPDDSNSDLIDNFELDYIFVQFYNNECNLHSKSEFNYNMWANHMLKLGYMKTRIFIGLPSTEDSAANGYVEEIEIINQRIDEINANYIESLYFGGMMFWDASKGFNHQERDSDDSYIYRVWKNLGGLESSNATVLDSGASFTNSSTGSTATRSSNSGQSLNSSGFGFVMFFISAFILQFI